MEDRDYISVLLRVRGLVQGVGYRYWTRSEALSLALEGYVKNLPDGSVEALLCGSRNAVENMMERMNSGPRSSFVEMFEVVRQSESDSPVKGFQIIR